MKFLDKIARKHNFGKYDPTKHCEVYKEIGCSHVDGFLCHFETCHLRKEYLYNVFFDKKFG